MNKIIRGKRYNTDTACRLACWENVPDTRDFSYTCEELYQKRSGEYFLYGEGNVYSKYATVHGDNRGWGEAIMPLTEDEARQWSETHLDGDEYESMFGTVEEVPVPPNHLSELMKKVNMSRRALSERSGIGESQLWRIEVGEIDIGNITARNLIKLSDALGVDPRELM